jgi:hypothetical protein
MKRFIVVMVLLLALPAAAWAQEFSNAELYQMIKKMERKFDEAIEQTNKALVEAEKAKEEAAIARDEAVRAKEEVALAKEETERVKEELAQIKAASAPATASATVPAEPLIREVESVPGLGASFEVVYMRPSRSNLDYVIKDSVNNGQVQGSFEKIEPDYTGGGKLGLSYDFGSGTAISSQYMMLNSRDSDSSVAPPGGALWGTWLHPNSIIDDNNVTSAKMRYDFDMDVFDLSAYKMFDVGSDLGVRIEAGLRYANTTQDINITYAQDPANLSADIYNKNDFSGWGPRVGLGLDWGVGQGFNLFSSLAGSVLVGDFDLSLRQIDDNNGVITTRADIEDKEKNRVVPVLEMRAGIGYAYQLDNGMLVGAKVGYEWQNWFNMVTAQRFMDDVDPQLMYTDTTDISIDGFFLEGFINF